MELRQLRTFLHVAELGSLSKAAERLHVAQPALGRQVKLLEEELDVPLFVRHGRGMALTTAGQTLFERASSIMRMVEDTRAEVTAARDSVRGSVSLGVPPTAGEVISGPLVEAFAKRYPDVLVRIVPAFSGYLRDMLRWGELDLAIMYETHDVQQLRLEPLILEPLYLFGPVSAPFPEGKPVTFAEAFALPMILPGPRHGMRALIDDEAQKRGIRLRVSLEADSSQTLKDLVARGLGYTVLPAAALRARDIAGTLKGAPIVDPPLARRLVLVWSVMKPGNNAVRLFADNLKAGVVDMVRDGTWPGELLIDTAP